MEVMGRQGRWGLKGCLEPTVQCLGPQEQSGLKGLSGPPERRGLPGPLEPLEPQAPREQTARAYRQAARQGKSSRK